MNPIYYPTMRRGATAYASRVRIGLLLLFGCTLARAEDLSLKWVLSRPEGKLPYRFTFFRDSSRIAYLKERAEDKQRLSDLWVYDI